jgi:hypothetical protein
MPAPSQRMQDRQLAEIFLLRTAGPYILASNSLLDLLRTRTEWRRQRCGNFRAHPG